MINFDTLFQLLSLCHEFRENTGALEALIGNITVQHELIRNCQTYLTFLEQYATLPPLPDILVSGASEAIQGYLAENEAILKGMEESRQALERDQQRIIVDIVRIIPRE